MYALQALRLIAIPSAPIPDVPMSWCPPTRPVPVSLPNETSIYISTAATGGLTLEPDVTGLRTEVRSDNVEPRYAEQPIWIFSNDFTFAVMLFN